MDFCNTTRLVKSINMSNGISIILKAIESGVFFQNSLMFWHFVNSAPLRGPHI